MSFLPYLPLPPEKGRGNARRTATLVGSGLASAINATMRDDTDLSRQRATSSTKNRGLLPPPGSNFTGSLQDLSRLKPDVSPNKPGSMSGRSSPFPSRVKLAQTLDPALNYLESGDEAQNLMRMNIQHLLRQKENEYVSRSDFTILCGTFNVNSQGPDGNLAPWFSNYPGAPVPDIIALAFQELDNANQAYVFTESPREPEWNTALAKTIHDVYEKHTFIKFRCVRLVGMMLVIFVRTSIAPAIDKVDTAMIGCGLLGRLGNKGGVAIRFNIHDTSVCFVSAHLSAHLEESDRRNQDFREINTRTAFEKFSSENNNEPLRIDHHDIVFWMGDLNYRIVNLSNEACKDLIKKGALDRLFQDHDQLHTEMRHGHVFLGYNEGPIKFRPTYKYDSGTDQWDSSEKARIPAWCDRILWKFNDEIQDTDPVTQIVYRSHQDVFIGDHKPVSAIFKASVRIVDQAKCDTVYKQILRDFDRNENQQRPQAEPDQREIDFDEIKFLESNVVNVNIKNTGTVPLEFVFKPTPNHPHGPAPRWLSVLPPRGKIAYGHSANVQLVARIDPNFVSQIALTPSREFFDVLVLHLVCGGDTFMPVKGRLALTCFGLPLSVLNAVANPIGLMDPSELAQMMGTDPKKLLKSFPLPKEVFRLVDRLSKPDALEHKELFRVQGTLQDKIIIRNSLDLTYPGETIPGSIPSVGEVLLDFLQSLPTPLVPVALQPQCKQVSSSTDLSCAFLDDTFQKNSPKHYALFLYLLKYLGEFVRHRRDNLIDIPFLAGLFAELAFRHSSSGADVVDVGYSARESHVPQQAVNFILRLLAKEAGLSWNEVSEMQSFGGESDA